MKQSILMGILYAMALSVAVHASESLDPARKELPVAQNAYSIWTNAVSALTLPDDTGLQSAFRLALNLNTNMPAGEARRQLDAWLESKKVPLALVSQGIALGRFQWPVFEGDAMAGAILSSALYRAVRTKCILAREHAERAEYADSAREFTEVFKMGQLIAAGDGPIIVYLMGIAEQSMALNGLRWLISRDDIPQDILRHIQNDLPVPRAEDPVLAQVYRVEHAQFMVPNIKKTMKDLSEPTNNCPIRISRVLDVTDTIKLAETFFSRFVSNALTPWPSRDTRIQADAKALLTLEGVAEPGDFVFDLTMSAFNKKDREGRKKWKQLEKLGRKQPNIFGKLFVVTIIPVGDKMHERSVKSRTEISLTRALVALQIHRKETGTWPESLEDTRFKELLPQPPIDFFSGRPVFYSRAKGILWSVGPDGTDDGGDAKKDIVVTFSNQVADLGNSKLGSGTR